MGSLRDFAPRLWPLLLLSACGDGEDAPSPGPPRDVNIAFELRLNGQRMQCGAAVAGVGTPATDFKLTDARFYIHDVELVGPSGAAHRIELDETEYQGQGLVLLDFEDGCGPDGSDRTNEVVTGSVPAGDYDALRFTLGVPAEQNFIDLATAAPPLDVTGMFWTWRAGYKFLKLDGSSPMEGGGIHPFFVHVGASGCPGDNPQAPPAADCASPNLARYELPNFSLETSVVVADVGALLQTTDLAFNTPESAPGCMSEPDDPECLRLLPRLGIDDANEQTWLDVD